MSLNPELYKAIQSGGLTLSSPSIGIGKDAISELDALSVALDNPALEALMVDTSLLESTKAAVSNANNSATGSVSHMTTTANQSLQMSSLTKAINTLDSEVDGMPSGCSNTTNLFGSIQGESDADFSELKAFAASLISGIADFIDGVIALDELETLMFSVSESFGSTVAKVESFINKEKTHYGEVVNKLNSLSLSQSIDRLWQDDCSRAVLEAVLPPDIKDLLK